MLRYQQLKNKPRTLLALTSVTCDEFATLLPSFAVAWDAYVQEHFIHDKPRQRRYGAGRRATLHHLEDKLLFILLYFKLYPFNDTDSISWQ
jgi:hypothetical protein